MPQGLTGPTSYFIPSVASPGRQCPRPIRPHAPGGSPGVSIDNAAQGCGGPSREGSGPCCLHPAREQPGRPAGENRTPISPDKRWSVRRPARRALPGLERPQRLAEQPVRREPGPQRGSCQALGPLSRPAEGLGTSILSGLSFSRCFLAYFRCRYFNPGEGKTWARGSRAPLGRHTRTHKPHLAPTAHTDPRDQPS